MTRWLSVLGLLVAAAAQLQPPSGLYGTPSRGPDRIGQVTVTGGQPRQTRFEDLVILSGHPSQASNGGGGETFVPGRFKHGKPFIIQEPVLFSQQRSSDANNPSNVFLENSAMFDSSQFNIHPQPSNAVPVGYEPNYKVNPFLSRDSSSQRAPHKTIEASSSPDRGHLLPDPGSTRRTAQPAIEPGRRNSAFISSQARARESKKITERRPLSSSKPDPTNDIIGQVYQPQVLIGKLSGSGRRSSTYGSEDEDGEGVQPAGSHVRGRPAFNPSRRGPGSGTAGGASQSPINSGGRRESIAFTLTDQSPSPSLPGSAGSLHQSSFLGSIDTTSRRQPGRQHSFGLPEKLPSGRFGVSLSRPQLNVNPGSGLSAWKGHQVDTCAASIVCVPDAMCNPYTGFVRGGLRFEPTGPSGLPTVALDRCSKLKDGGIGDGVCCRMPHINDPWPQFQ